MSDAIQRFLEHRAYYCAPKTLVWYDLMLDPLARNLGARSIERISSDELAVVLSQQRGRLNQHGRPLTAATRAGYVRAFRIFFNWSVQCGYRSDNPALFLKSPRWDHLPRALTPEQTRELLRRVKKLSVRDRALILFLLETGCRAGELCALQFSDLVLRGRYCFIANGKGGVQRLVGFGTRTADALREYLRGRKRSGYVFLTQRGAPFTVSGLRSVMRRAERGLSFHLFTHGLRHTALTDLAMRGLDPVHIQTLAGHASAATTEGYIRLARQRAALKAQRRVLR